MTTEAAGAYKASLDRLAAIGSDLTDPTAWNAAVRELRAAYLVLRETEAGRLEIEEHLEHRSPAARGWSAAHVLLWDEPSARPILEALIDAGGIAGFTAEQSLRSYDAGTLTHD